MPGVDLNYFIRQANKLTEKIEQRKKELAEETVEGKAGDGLVTAVANCIQEVRSIKIDPKAIDPNDPELLADMVLAATNEAMRSARALMEQRLGGLAGGGGGGGRLPRL